jgi:hypothetical protein
MSTDDIDTSETTPCKMAVGSGFKNRFIPRSEVKATSNITERSIKVELKQNTYQRG